MSLFDRFSPVFTDELRGKPLYTLIRNAVRPDGSLPVDFALPQKAWRHKITFMDGALDGIMLYHSDSPDRMYGRCVLLSTRSRREISAVRIGYCIAISEKERIRGCCV